MIYWQQIGGEEMRITKKPDERREEIVQAARELFGQNGFAKTTISDIAQRIGIAKGLFYYYFRTKDEVMNAVVDEYISETSEVVRHIVEQDTDFLKRMNQVVFTIIEFTQKTETVFAELKDSDRFMFHQSILEYAVERFRQQVAGLVEEGVEKGIICCKHPYTTVEILFYGFGMLNVSNMEREQVIDIVGQALCVRQEQ
ncbi:TetR/AcrR family transcriptional regulator [Harryflintia acetispora]|nr:TetR/AcrR family transcriptional regulator [Harryflintia acetispora]